MNMTKRKHTTSSRRPGKRTLFATSSALVAGAISGVLVRMRRSRKRRNTGSK